MKHLLILLLLGLVCSEVGRPHGGHKKKAHILLNDAANEKLANLYKARKITTLLQQRLAQQSQLPADQPVDLQEGPHPQMEESISLLEKCLSGEPVVLLETRDLPAENRANGDPCTRDSQCASQKCVCKPWGGKECTGAAPPSGLSIDWESWQSSFQVNQGATSDQLLGQVPAPSNATKGYCARNLDSLGTVSNNGVCSFNGGTTSNIGEQIRVRWWQDCPQTGEFRWGYDTGYGNAVIVDGKLDSSVVTNINLNWWSGDWSSPWVAHIGPRTWAAGYHEIKFLGWEPCCDGNEAIQYRVPNGNWLDLDQSFCFGPCS